LCEDAYERLRIDSILPHVGDDNGWIEDMRRRKQGLPPLFQCELADRGRTTHDTR
jgi:hypothetical protein